MVPIARFMAPWFLVSAFVAIGQSAAQIPSAATSDGNAEEIVVTAQRTGIPVWRVKGPRTTVILVGSIGRVSPGTRWDPVALDAALAQADRVMFPEATDVSVGLFSIIGLVGKWHAQASLPAGQTLQTMTTPEQWARLVALRDRGILKPGFERTHPYHLAMSLSRSVRDRQKLDPGVNGYVRRFLARNRAKQVPVAQGSIKDLTADFFASAPREHVACLMGSPQVTLAVVSLDSLARPGGVLDDLVATGFDVRGPRWKR